MKIKRVEPCRRTEERLTRLVIFVRLKKKLVFMLNRLKHESHGGAWCPRQQITPEPKEWLEIDLHTVHMITATGTQGRFGNGQGAEYAEAYQLEYWRPRLGRWVRYKNVRGEEVSAIHHSNFVASCFLRVNLDSLDECTKIRNFPAGLIIQMTKTSLPTLTKQQLTKFSVVRVENSFPLVENV